jgi:arginyl-tRNA synthetase
VVLELQTRLGEAIRAVLKEKYDLQLESIPLETPPDLRFGEIATPIAFELARKLRKAPKVIAQELVAALGTLDGFAGFEAAGAGYINARLDRAAALRLVTCAEGDSPSAQDAPQNGGHVLVEHTSINPNKAAHIGHLRNAILGDTFVRLLRAAGFKVDVQNYIDNTGVQVADVVVGFLHLEGKSVADVRQLIEQSPTRAADQAAASSPSQQPSASSVAQQGSFPPAAQPGSASSASQQDLASSALCQGTTSVVPPEEQQMGGALAPAAAPLFDYYCWDLYARTSRWYEGATGEEQQTRKRLRYETLHAIERGNNETAEIAELISTAVLRRHLETMLRLGIEYDFLPRESEILHLKFWEAAFEQLKKTGVLYFETEGKNKGCWVMTRPAAAGKPGASTQPDRNENGAQGTDEDAKVIVRSNGTVTYVGKDIAYHLWKFGLLGRDFGYMPFFTYPDHECWISTEQGIEPHPHFGGAQAIYNVIDSRQSDPQANVIQALRGMGHTAEAEHYTHFSYEMVALTPRCAVELGYTVSEEDRSRPYIEVSGRKGFGVKADDLIDKLIAATRAEVDARQTSRDEAERRKIAIQIAIGALRYFMLKYTRNSVIAFDFKDALSFEGETGPYIQYAVVRIRNIFRKGNTTPDAVLEAFEKLASESAAAYEPAVPQEVTSNAPRNSTEAAQCQGTTSAVPQTGPEKSGALAPAGSPASGVSNLAAYLSGEDNEDIWSLWLRAGRFSLVLDQCIAASEPAYLAKHAFQLAQEFNNFYHKHHILTEEDAHRKTLLLATAAIALRELIRALALLGIDSPEAM